MASKKRDAPAAPPNQRQPKRIRKAINCEPCRNSKLKCDRNRPCSGCTLRGTVAQCYPDESPASEPVLEKEDSTLLQADLRTEIARIRQSLNVLESIIPRQGSSFVQTHSATTNTAPKPPSPGKGGVYFGPTAAASAVLSIRSELTGLPISADQPDPPLLRDLRDPRHNADILSEVPTDFSVTEGLFAFFFENCTYFAYHLDQRSFYAAWSRARQSEYTDHLVLSTMFMVLAIASQYLPSNHPYVPRLPAAPSIIGPRWYTAAVVALRRYQRFKCSPNLDFVELLLLRMHYLSISEIDCEEAWGVKCEIASTTIAMGLHRDPGTWDMSQEEITRRRWTWWNYIVIDRWQAFRFGRPLAISPHHFDTRYPVDEHPDPSATVLENPLLAYLASFKLAVILGDIVSDAVSAKPVPYDRVKDHDIALERWLESLPPDLRADPQHIVRCLSGSTSAPLQTRQIALQSLWLRVQMYHVRFVLHRPYTNANIQTTPAMTPESTGTAGAAGTAGVAGTAGTTPAPSKSDSIGTKKSFEAAVHSADMIIQYLSATAQAIDSSISLSVPGHIAWSGYHVFAAAIFFSFQLIMRPDQPSRSLFRAAIQTSMTILEMLKKSQHLPQQATRALTVLYALSPLFDDDLDDRAKAEQIDAVRSLPFPCHSKPFYPRPRAQVTSTSGGGGIPTPKARNRPPDLNVSTKPTTTEASSVTAAAPSSSSATQRPVIPLPQQSSSSSHTQPPPTPLPLPPQHRLHQYPSYNQRASPSTTTTENTTPTPPPHPPQPDTDANYRQRLLIVQQQQYMPQHLQQQSYPSSNAIASRSNDNALIPTRALPLQLQTTRDQQDRHHNSQHLHAITYRQQQLQEQHYNSDTHHNHSAPPPHTVKPHSPPTPTPPMLQPPQPRQQLPPLILPSHRIALASVATTSQSSSQTPAHPGPNDPVWAMGMGLAESTGRWGSGIDSRQLQRPSSPSPQSR